MKNNKVLVISIALIFVSVIVHARDLYISPTGSGTAYTLASPGSAKGALAAAQAGDTVMFLDGRYTDTSATSWEYAFNTSSSGTSASPITLKSVNPRGAVIIRNSPNIPALGIENRNYIIIDGFKTEGAIQLIICNNSTIKNCEVTIGEIQGSDVSLHWGIAIQLCNYCKIQNNYVHDMSNEGNHGHNGACIMVFGASDYNIIEYNSVNGGNKNVYSAYGTKAGDMDDNIWRYNFADGCHTGFLAMGDTADSNYTRRNKVYNNVVINTTYFFESHHGAEDWEVYNNTWYNGSYFCQLGSYPESYSVCPKRHSFWNNIGYATTDIYAKDTSAPVWSSTFSYSNYNLIYNASGYWASAWSVHLPLTTWRSNTGFDTNTLTTNPNFVNLGGTSPSNYKRTLYTADGRGGSYASVMGAYITGAETIGYSAGVTPSDTTPPASPIGISLTIIQ